MNALNHANTATRKKSRFTLLLSAIAAGTMTAGALLPHAAMAQEEAPEPTNSQSFAQLYGPIANTVTGETKDWAGAATRIPELKAAMKNRKDRHTTGNFMLIVGGQVNDDRMRREGIELMLRSTLVPAEDVARFHYYSGSLAFNYDEPGSARASWKRAVDAGYADNDGDVFNDPQYLIAQSLIQEERERDAFEFLLPYLEANATPGAGQNDKMIRLGLQAAIDIDDTQMGNRFARMLIEDGNSAETWKVGLQVVAMMNPMDEKPELELYRLMRDAGAMTQRPEYIRYIESADPRLMSNELDDVLAEGLRDGFFKTSGDQYYLEVKQVIDTRKAIDMRELDQTVAEGRNGDAAAARIAGDILYSVDDFGQAAGFYELAAERGYQADAAHTRVGIAHTMAGNYSEAMSAFASVSGDYAVVAEFWALYAQSKMPAAPAPAPAAEPMMDDTAAMPTT